MTDIDEQLRALTLRLNRLEDAVLNLSKNRPGAAAVARVSPGPAPAEHGEDRFFRNTVPQGAETPATPRPANRPQESPFFQKSSTDEELSVTQIMGWTGATLLVLAAA